MTQPLKDAFNPRRLPLAMRRRGLDLYGLAAELDIPMRTMRRYLNGKDTPVGLEISRIALALNFPVEFFFGPTLEEQPEEIHHL